MIRGQGGGSFLFKKGGGGSGGQGRLGDGGGWWGRWGESDLEREKKNSCVEGFFQFFFHLVSMCWWWEGRMPIIQLLLSFFY